MGQARLEQRRGRRGEVEALRGIAKSASRIRQPQRGYEDMAVCELASCDPGYDR